MICFGAFGKAGFERKGNATKSLHTFQFSFCGVKLGRSYEIVVLTVAKEATTDSPRRAIELAGEPSFTSSGVQQITASCCLAAATDVNRSVPLANRACQSICLLMGTIANATRVALKFPGLAR